MLPIQIPTCQPTDPILAGETYRRKGSHTNVTITRSSEDVNGIRRVWYRRPGTFHNISNETWEYEQNFRIDFERIPGGV